MKEPTTPEEVKVLHNLLRSDPQHYLQIVNKWIADNPGNSHAYFDRHFVWMKLGEPQRAIADLDMVIQLDPKPVTFWALRRTFGCMPRLRRKTIRVRAKFWQRSITTRGCR